MEVFQHAGVTGVVWGQGAEAMYEDGQAFKDWVVKAAEDAEAVKGEGLEGVLEIEEGGGGLLARWVGGGAAEPGEEGGELIEAEDVAAVEDGDDGAVPEEFLEDAFGVGIPQVGTSAEDGGQLVGGVIGELGDLHFGDGGPVGELGGVEMEAASGGDGGALGDEEGEVGVGQGVPRMGEVADGEAVKLAVEGEMGGEAQGAVAHAKGKGGAEGAGDLESFQGEAQAVSLAAEE